MTIPEWLEDVINTFESRTEPFTAVSIAEVMKQARNTQGNLSDSDWKTFLAEHSAFYFLERLEKDSAWGTYFAPMFEATRLDGTRCLSPDIAELNAETVNHWKERAVKARNPILRGRYADCVWDLGPKITDERPNYKYALIAVEAYIEAMERDGYANEITVAPVMTALEMDGIELAARAVQIARSVNNQGLASRAAVALIDLCDRHIDPAHAGVWLAPFDILYDQKGLLSAEQETKIIRDLETMLARTSNPEAGKDFNPWGAQSAAERLNRHYKNAEERKRLVKTYGAAFEKISRDASPMLAMAWTQPIIERYEQEGLTSDAERLSLFAAEKGKRIGEDLKTYTVRVPIEKELLAKEVDDLLGGNELRTILFRIALTFIPSVKQSKQSLNKAGIDAPLLSHFTQHILNSEGQTTARIGSGDEDPEGRLQKQTADVIGMTQMFLSHTLSEFKNRLAPTSEEIVAVIFECPFFLERRRGLVAEGIAAYLAEDWVKAIHVLIPQIEDGLRNLLAGIGVPIYKTGRAGIMDVKNMTDALVEPRLQAKLGEDLWRYLFALFVDRRGLNVRNQVSHGLVNYDGFNHFTADLVFHGLLTMSTLRMAKETL